MGHKKSGRNNEVISLHSRRLARQRIRARARKKTHRISPLFRHMADFAHACRSQSLTPSLIERPQQITQGRWSYGLILRTGRVWFFTTLVAKKKLGNSEFTKQCLLCWLEVCPINYQYILFNLPSSVPLHTPYEALHPGIWHALLVAYL